jgi:hypothetical protein
VQVDSIKPVLKAPITKRLKLKIDGPLSSFAFKFNLRRYNKEIVIEKIKDLVQEKYGGIAETVMVRRCRLTLSSPS